MEVLEILWIIFVNISIYSLLIYIAYVFLFMLASVLGSLLKYFFNCNNMLLSFFYKHLVEEDKVSTFFLYYMFIICVIDFILAFILKKGIFANPFLGS